MLGIIPEVAQFVGLPLDIRAITLVNRFFDRRSGDARPRRFGDARSFSLAAMGIAAIGFMNLTVSFSLAMFVATRACAIQAPERHAIYGAVARRVARQPWSFFFPTNGAGALCQRLCE